MAQNTPESKGSPYWEGPPMAEEEMIEEKEYDLDDGNWKQMPGDMSYPEQNPMEKPTPMPMPERPQNQNHQTMPTPNPEDRPQWMMDYALAMAYVPRQKWADLYQPDVGFSRGTIFPALDKPFIGEGGMAR